MARDAVEISGEHPRPQPDRRCSNPNTLGAGRSAEGPQSRAFPGHGAVARCLDSRLPRRPPTASRFYRIHRSHIVNIERVRELQPWFNGEYVVFLKDGTRLTLSRSYRKLQERLGRRL